jgi:hypothetical protein
MLKRLAKRKETAGFAPLVADMRRVIANSRAKAKAKPEPQPQPAPMQDGPASADLTKQ